MTKRKPLDVYESEFMSAERHYRQKKSDWESVIQELHADRGMLLGSTQYADFTGVERCESLSQIDTAIKDAHEHIAWLRVLRDKAVTIPFPYKNRARRVRRKVSALSDEALGVSE